MLSLYPAVAGLCASGQSRTPRSRKALSLLTALLLALGAALSVRADSTVTNCTEAALLAAIATGGNVQFQASCTQALSGPILISADTAIKGQGYAVTLNGNGNGPVFTVAPGVQFSLTGIAITGGKSARGGAIRVESGASAALTNCILGGNQAIGTDGSSGTDGTDGAWGGAGDGTSGQSGTAGVGGAIYNLGDLALVNCVLLTNSATGGNGGDGGNGGSAVLDGGNGGDGGNGANAVGGAIYNLGTLIASNCTFGGNAAVGGSGGTGGTAGSGSASVRTGVGGAGALGLGGSIYSTQAVTIVNCTFATNTVRGGDSQAGGILVNGNGSNGAPGGEAYGGGVFARGIGAFTNATFFSNASTGGTGGSGGNAANGAWNAGNGGDGGNAFGGNLYTSGDLVIVNCTVVGGRSVGGTNGVAGSTGAVGYDGSPGTGYGGNAANAAGKMLKLKNSIVASSSSGGNISGTITDAGNNIRSGDPKLGSLAANGGPTLTLMPQIGSPAVKAADAAWAPRFDQRGYVRPGAGKAQPDIGAVEGVTVSITSQPAGVTVTSGGTATFSVSASGDSPMKYLWRFGDATLSSATNTSLTITNATATSAGDYTVLVYNAFGSVTSSPARLTVAVPITILQQPVSQKVQAGANVSFSIVSTGVPPASVQWKFNGTNLAGATTSTLALNNVQAANGGTYVAALTNLVGSVTSSAATLTVVAPIALSVAGVNSGGFNFVFPVQPNVSYAIDFKTNLAQPVWEPWKTGITTTVQGWFTNTFPMSNQPSSYFRLRME